MKRARTYYLRPIALAVYAAMSLMVPAHADTARGTVNGIVSVLASGRSMGSLSTELNKKIDFTSIAQSSFDPAEWQSFSASQKQQITASLQQLIQHRYYKRWQRLFKKHPLIVDDQANSGGYTYVRSHVMDGTDREEVIWRLSQKGGGLKVSDLSVDGKDMIARLKERSAIQLHKRGPAKFVAWLKEEATDHADSDEDTARTSSQDGENM